MVAGSTGQCRQLDVINSIMALFNASSVNVSILLVDSPGEVLVVDRGDVAIYGSGLLQIKTRANKLACSFLVTKLSKCKKKYVVSAGKTVRKGRTELHFPTDATAVTVLGRPTFKVTLRMDSTSHDELHALLASRGLTYA